jgi:pimeloyl-ACP methyl ester carboxylesterase
VLLIHGAKGSLYDHELELAPLLRDRYRVITVDRPGSGYSERVPRDRVCRGEADSPRESGSPFVQADLLHELLHELEAAPAIVLGHSAGAPVALALALRHPHDVAGLVTAAGYTHAVRPLGTPLARLLRARLLGRLFRAAFLAPAVALAGPLVLSRIAAPERAPRAYARGALALNYDPARSAGDAEDVAVIERDLRLLAPEYPQIVQPLIAVHGSEDQVLWPQQSERLVDAVPGAELRPIAGAGHLLPVTRAAELAAAVDDVAARRRH